MFRFFPWFHKREKEKIDEGLNVVAGISKAKTLYKELIILVHPDKHPDKQELALSLTQQINRNRYNYNELLKLKEIIDSILK